VVAVALAEAGHVDQALELADRIDDQRTGGWLHDDVTQLIARLVIIAADRGRLEAARKLAVKARALLAAYTYPRDMDRVSVAAAWARMGEPEQAVSVLAELSPFTESTWRPAGWPEIGWWYNIDWDELSGWAVSTPRRDAAIIVAHQAVLADADDALLAAADTELAEVVRAAVAVARVHAGGPDRAGDLLTTLTSDQARAQVLLALADALADSSPPEARAAARQALHCTEAARAEAAVLLARAGAAEEAVEVAQAIPVRAITRGGTFARLAEILGLLGDPAEAGIARDLIDRTTFDSDVGDAPTAAAAFDALRRRRDSSSYPLVRRAIAARDADELSRVLPELDDLPERRFVALAHVARGQLNAGRRELARLAALHALSVLPVQAVEHDHARFLKAVARALARAGRPKQALAVAERAGHPEARTSAVAQVAAGLLETGATDAARTLIGTGSQALSQEIADLLYHEGLTELAHHVPKKARQAAEREMRWRSETNQQLAALINAPDGTDPHTVAGYDNLRRWSLTEELADRLASAGRFDTAVAVIFDEHPWEPRGYDDDPGGLPGNETIATALAKVAAQAHRVPARRQWARERAEEARRIALVVGSPSAPKRLRTIGENAAGRARALAAVTGYPGWPDEAALAMFRDALRLTLDWNRYVFFSALTEAVPYLARLGDEILAQTVQQIIDVDAWWTPRPAYP
jgi:hypothetical protein